MKLTSFVVGPLLVVSTAGLFFGATLPASARQQIRVYEIPKERVSSGMPSGAADPHAGVPNAMPALKWAKLPEGWKVNPAPGAMRAASFIVSNGEGNEAEMAAIPMGGMSNIEGQLVNMWRGQVKLPPLNDEEMAKQFSDLPVGDATGKLFELASTEPVIGDKYKARILVAMLKQPDTTWFFKFAGEDTLVAAQRANFLEFLKGVSFEAPPADALPPGHPPMAGGMGAGGMGQGMMGGAMQGGDLVKAGTGPHPEWVVPASWVAVDHSSFLVAKFRVTGEGGTQADINVSSSAGTGGGLLPNVNRWRGQLSLGAIDQTALDKLVTTLDLPVGKATVVDFSGEDAEHDTKSRCVGVMVPVAGSTWFYKLAGSEAVVAREKEALLNFVRSVKY